MEKKRDFMSITEFAKELGISKSKAYELVNEGKLPFEVVYVGTRRVISRKAYEIFYERASKVYLPSEDDN